LVVVGRRAVGRKHDGGRSRRTFFHKDILR
jgi:hypothetical protein